MCLACTQSSYISMLKALPMEGSLAVADDSEQWTSQFTGKG